MATAGPQLQNQLALVSSLYGPGTITCWYLTVLSVLMSWTLHPEKRKSGSVDVDFIAVLTLPAVAAGHLISQVRRSLNHAEVVKVQANGSADLKYLQSFAAIEASFNVTETFMAISIILFLIAAWTFCIRRAILLALTGLLCFAVECYLHFSEFIDLNPRHEPGVSADKSPVFSRFFVADFAGLMIAILAILSLCGLISAAIAFWMLFPPRTAPSSPRQDIERVNEGTSPERMRSRFGVPAVEVTHDTETTHATRMPRSSGESSLKAITLVTTLFLPVSFIASVIPLTWSSTDRQDSASATTSLWQTLHQSATRLARDLFPRTACSITDLDQVVAATAGATVLGFSIYSVAKAYYMIWKERRTPSDRTDTELSSFANRAV